MSYFNSTGKINQISSQLATIATDVVAKFGADPTGVNDSTQAIQNAINATLSLFGGKLYFPAGTYKITAALTIPQAAGFIIFGHSRGSVTIKQFTDNTPIFKFTNELSHSWKVSEIGFDYANHQPNTNTLAIPIYFELPSGTSNGGGMFNFLIDHCFFNGGYYGVMQTQQSQGLPLWGIHIKDCAFGGYLSGGAVNISPNPAIGQPIIKLEDVYINAANMTKSIIAIYNSDTVLLDSVEINGGSASANVNVHIEIQTCQNVVLLNTRCEAVTVNGSNATVWDFANSYVTVIGCTQSLILSASAYAIGLHAGNNGRISIHGFQFGYSSLGNGATGVAVTADDIIILENLNIPSGQTSALSRSSTPARIDMLYVQPNKTKYQGDANVSLTSSDSPIQYFNTAFTANRQVNLPTSGLYDGMEFTIVKYATDSYSLKVYDGVTGKSVTIPAGSKGSSKWRAVGTSEWVPVSQSTFS